MKSWVLLMLLWLLTACSHTPHWLAPGDQCPEAEAAIGLLQIYSDRGRYNLVVHRERSGEQITYVALDAIGAPQFTANRMASGFVVEQSPLYRGVDPQWLLWGWQWWQLREGLLPECAARAGLDVQPLPEGDGWQLSQKARPVWRWRSDRPDQYELPEQRARISVRELQAAELDVTTK